MSLFQKFVNIISVFLLCCFAVWIVANIANVFFKSSDRRDVKNRLSSQQKSKLNFQRDID